MAIIGAKFVLVQLLPKFLFSKIHNHCHDCTVESTDSTIETKITLEIRLDLAAVLFWQVGIS